MDWFVVVPDQACVRQSQHELDGLAPSLIYRSTCADLLVGPTCAQGLCSYSVLSPNDLVAGCELDRPLDFCLIAVTFPRSCPWREESTGTACRLSYLLPTISVRLLPLRLIMLDGRFESIWNARLRKGDESRLLKSLSVTSAANLVLIDNRVGGEPTMAEEEGRLYCRDCTCGGGWGAAWVFWKCLCMDA